MSDDLNVNIKGIVACDTLLGILCLQRVRAYRQGYVDTIDKIDRIISVLVDLKDSLFNEPVN